MTKKDLIFHILESLKMNEVASYDTALEYAAKNDTESALMNHYYNGKADAYENALRIVKELTK